MVSLVDESVGERPAQPTAALAAAARGVRPVAAAAALV